MIRIWRMLFDHNLSLSRYCVVAFVFAIIPSLLLNAAVLYGLPALGVDISRYQPQPTNIRLIDLFGSILLAPIVETMLLALGLHILSRIAKRTIPLAALSALIWGAIHGLLAPTRFAGTVWSFFVFSIAYLTWCELGRTRAFAASAIPHAILNLFVLALAIL